LHYTLQCNNVELNSKPCLHCPVPPLFVIEFLHRVVNTFDDYFTECTESTLKENYVIVYEVVID